MATPSCPWTSDETTAQAGDGAVSVCFVSEMTAMVGLRFLMSQKSLRRFLGFPNPLPLNVRTFIAPQGRRRSGFWAAVGSSWAMKAT